MNTTETTDKVIEAIKRANEAIYNSDANSIYEAINHLKKSLTAHEQEQSKPEQTEVKTKEDILSQMKDIMPWDLSPRLEPYILEALDIYASKEVSKATAPLLKTAEHFRKRFDETLEINQHLLKRIEELENENKDLMVIEKSYAGITNDTECPYYADLGKCIPGCGTDTCKHHPNYS